MRASWHRSFCCWPELQYTDMNEVTRILSAIDEGDPAAAEDLLPLVYRELRTLAAAKLSNEKPGQTLQATVLVHEAYLRLVDADRPQQWNGRAHFFGAAAEAMRRILIENARRKQSRKCGGGKHRVDFRDLDVADELKDEGLLALDEALSQLEALWPKKAQLVKLRYFAGMTMPEVSDAMGVSLATAERYWAFARAWLYSELKKCE